MDKTPVADLRSAAYTLRFGYRLLEVDSDLVAGSIDQSLRPESFGPVRPGRHDGGMNRDEAGIVAERLAADGWVLRRLRPAFAVTLTRGAEVQLAVQLLPTSVKEHRLRIGAGYGPALDLMPLLTLPAAPILAGGQTVVLTAHDHAYDDVATAVREHAAALTDRFPHVTALLDAVSSRDELVMLAALGRAEELRGRLTEAEPGDRRLARQLHRRLSQGLPPAPPVEDTLAVLAPAPGPEPWPDRRALWATARARTRGRRAAYRAARRKAAGRSRAGIAALIEAEFRARGQDTSPGDTALRAQMIELRQQPLGLARAGVTGTMMAVSAILGMIRLLRTGGFTTADSDPGHLRPPDRAGYRVPTSSRYTAVPADPDRLERIAAPGHPTGRTLATPRRLAHPRAVRPSGRPHRTGRDRHNRRQRRL